MNRLKDALKEVLFTKGVLAIFVLLLFAVSAIAQPKKLKTIDKIQVPSKYKTKEVAAKKDVKDQLIKLRSQGKTKKWTFQVGATTALLQNYKTGIKIDPNLVKFHYFYSRSILLVDQWSHMFKKSSSLPVRNLQESAKFCKVILQKATGNKGTGQFA